MLNSVQQKLLQKTKILFKIYFEILKLRIYLIFSNIQWLILRLQFFLYHYIILYYIIELLLLK